MELSYLSATFLFSVGGRPVGAGRWRAMPSSKWGQNEDERRKMICAPKVGHKQKVNEKE